MFEEKFSENMPSFDEDKEKEISPEKGKNVYICLKFIRHGERTPEGKLTDYGREITRKKAKESGIRPEEFDAVKAIGSPAGPEGPEGLQRALETADIFAEEVGGAKKFKTRKREILSYETLKVEEPYNHKEIYNANLPENFEQLSDEEKTEASKKAQAVAVNHLFSLKTPEAAAYIEETAGAFASVVSTYQEMSSRLKSNSKVLMVGGTHGPSIECFLREALIRKIEDGGEIRGFENIDEIGGPIDPSESISIDIKRDQEGNLLRLDVKFDNPERPNFPEMYFDPGKLVELKKYYDELHQEKEQS